MERRIRQVQIETALLIGVLFAAATYLILQNSFVRILFGFIILSNAANLLLLSLSGDPSGKTAPIAGEETVAVVDPLPQALILTAIVIGFGVAAYLVLLLYRLFLDQKTANAAELHDGPAGGSQT
jgi:multicomponent Na+:H+ antiporter subunit C